MSGEVLLLYEYTTKIIWFCKDENANTKFVKINIKLFDFNNIAVSANEDKLWADVDKDIGELLREVDPQGNEGTDDEEDLDR